MYIVLKDSRIEHVYTCDGYDENHSHKRETVSVDPTFFQEAGTPVCPDCGDDMNYLETRYQLEEV